MDENKYFENIAQYRLLAKKEVGQNFLISSAASKRIVDLLDIQKGEKVLEIGSGAGSLSYFLAQSEGDVDLIDIDEGLLTKLEQDFAEIEHVHPQYGNAMKWDYSSYDKIVGNLPYYITSGIIEKVILGAKKAKTFVFMIQKEAAERILAKPGSKDYSPLNVLLSLSGELKSCFFVPRSCFAPAPHVDSSVLKYVFSPYEEKIGDIYRLCIACFKERRKTILNNLKACRGKEKAEKALALASIDPKLRPEQLSPQDFSSLARALDALE